MAGAGCGLDQGGVDIADVVDLEDLAVRVGTVFGETTSQSSTVTAPLGRG